MEVDGDAAGDIRLTGEVFPSNIEYLVKGSLSGSPSIIANSSFSDSLKLLVDGKIFGSPMIDGGLGGALEILVMQATVCSLSIVTGFNLFGVNAPQLVAVIVIPACF